MDIVVILKAMGEETRIRILQLLHKEALCVCDLEKVLGVSQSNASRHLAALRRAGLIRGEKKAQWVYYRVDETMLEKVGFVKELLNNELDKRPDCQKDLARLKKYRANGGGCGCSINLDED